MDVNGLIEDDLKLKNLKDVIKNIAKSQTQEINSDLKNNLTNKHKFDVGKKAEQLISLKCFKGLDQASIGEEIKILEGYMEDTMEKSILVKDQGINKLVPLSYEVLRLLFISTDEEFRQNFFHELIEYYYQELCQNMKRLSISNSFVKENFDQQVKVLLPIVKCETALELVHDKASKSQKHFQEIISNLTSFFENSRLNQEDIYAIVNNKLKSKDYKLLSYKMIPLDERNGHLGDYFKLIVNVEYENTKTTLDLFAKFLTPTLEAIKEIVQSGPSKKEEFFYMTYLPLLKKHGLQSLLDFCPRCYFSRQNDVLVLDDLAVLDYTSLTPNNKLEYDALLFVVKQLAKLHSCSMILEELLSQEAGKKVSLYDIYAEYLQEVSLIENQSEFMDNFFKTALSSIHYLAEKFPEFNKTLTQDKLAERIDSGWKSMFEKVKISERFKNTICHGDVYVSNMLFKFDTNRACQGTTLLDFQLLRYCPPAQDLVFFLYQNSFQHTRKEHFKQLIDKYYSDVSRYLEDFNVDVTKIYPREDFEESLKYMKSQAVFQSLFYNRLTMLEPDLREKIFHDPELSKKYLDEEKTALVELGLETNDNYKKALTGLLQDIIELYENDPL